MARYNLIEKLEIILLSSSSIVLLGRFNPAIFHPQWFDRFKILPIQEIQWAEGKEPRIIETQHKDRKIIIEEIPPLIVTPDLADLRFPSLRILVRLDRFLCSAVQRKHFSLIKDVTIKSYNLLKHTPIDALGINFDGHWKFKDNANIILRNLFAKGHNSFKKTMGNDYQIGGIITSHQSNRKTTLKFDTSDRLQDGIYFNANFHREIKARQAEQATKLISENYNKDLEDIISIVKGLIGEPEETWEPKPQKE